MKTKLLLGIITFFFALNFSTAQNSQVVIKVKWKQKSYENKLEIYNAANDLVMSICDDTQCYSGTQLGGTDHRKSK